MNLVFPVALGYARKLQHQSRLRSERSNPGMLLYFCALIMVSSVILSGSRAGSFIAVLILLVWGIAGWSDIRRRGAPRPLKAVSFMMPIAIVLGLVVLWRADIVFQELSRSEVYLAGDASTRWVASISTWKMFCDHPWFGVGAGAFNVAFPYYQPESLLGFYRHAHNDWVQWLAELGVVGCSLGAVSIVMALRIRSSKAQYISRSIILGVTLGLAGMMLHATLDFPFRIPGIVAVAVVWLGVLSRRNRN
jgi:O-antigen ligase